MSFPLFENDEQEEFKVTPLMIQKTKYLREKKEKIEKLEKEYHECIKRSE